MKTAVSLICPKFGRVWTSLDKFGQVWTNLDKFEQIWTSLDKFGLVIPIISTRKINEKNSSFWLHRVSLICPKFRITVKAFLSSWHEELKHIFFSFLLIQWCFVEFLVFFRIFQFCLDDGACTAPSPTPPNFFTFVICKIKKRY